MSDAVPSEAAPSEPAPSEAAPSEAAPSEAVVAAWVRLSRAQGAAFGAVERAVRAAGFPRLEWYDVLLELERGGPLRPRDLQARLLFAQYNLSRLLDRMAAAGMVERTPCPDDQRGSLAAITPAGRRLRRRMWRVYGPAIGEAVGARLDEGEAAELARLLDKLSGPAR
jgi:DNA-binding MarR family transcriptional regulator